MNHGLSHEPENTRVSTLLKYHCSSAEIIALFDVSLQRVNADCKCAVELLAPNFAATACDKYETCGACIKGLTYSRIHKGDFADIFNSKAHAHLYGGRNVQDGFHK